MTDLKTYAPRKTPGKNILTGSWVRLEPVDWERHGEDLYAAVCGPEHDDLWTYLTFGPFSNAEDFKNAMRMAAHARQWETLVICAPDTGRALGSASYMRIRQTFGSTEVGCVIFGPGLKQTRAATQAMYLMACHAFDELGYRRYEWKCDNNNAASKRAAIRFGFIYEGVFRNDMIVKGRSRDTAWFAMTDNDWPKIKAAFEGWLAPDNFDQSGRQKQALAAIRAAL